MAWKAGSDYNRMVKGLVDQEGPQRARQSDWEAKHKIMKDIGGIEKGGNEE